MSTTMGNITLLKTSKGVNNIMTKKELTAKMTEILAIQILDTELMKINCPNDIKAQDIEYGRQRGIEFAINELELDLKTITAKAELKAAKEIYWRKQNGQLWKCNDVFNVWHFDQEGE